MLPDFICRKPRSITQRKFWKGTLYMWNLMHVATHGVYRIAGKFGKVNVWRIDFYKLFGEEKFGEWFKNNYCAKRRFVLCATIK